MRRPVLSLVLCALAVLVLAGPAAAQLTEADVYVGQAVIDFEDRRYDAALANLQRALELEPDHVEALYYAGVVHMALRRPAEAVPLLERAQKLAPQEPVIAVQLGLAHFALQQYGQAEPLLEGAFRADPTFDGLGYYVGFLRYRNKDYRGAVEAFRVGRSSDPEIQQLTRVYTGLALAAQGLPAQAAAEVEEALRLAPGSPLTGPTERLRDAVVTARERDRRLRAEIRVGLIYDDNVRVLPDRVGLGGDPLVGVIRDQSHRSTDSIGELFLGRVDYTFLKTEDWEASAGYSFFYTYYNDLPSFNVMDHLVTLTAFRKTAVAGMPVNVGAQYAFDALFLDEDVFVLRHSATLFGTIVENDANLTQVLLRFQYKDFDDEPIVASEDRDANNWMAGFLHFFRFAEDRHFVKLGYQFDYENAAGRNYEYLGHRILAGGQYTLPWYAVRLKYDIDVHLRGYVNDHTLLPSDDPGHRKRYDKELNHIVRVEVPLPASLTLAAEYLNTTNHSNLDVFDYTRRVYSLSLSWTY